MEKKKYRVKTVKVYGFYDNYEVEAEDEVQACEKVEGLMHFYPFLKEDFHRLKFEHEQILDVREVGDK